MLAYFKSFQNVYTAFTIYFVGHTGKNETWDAGQILNLKYYRQSNA